MLDPKRMIEAEIKNVAFICRMCERWYRGEDMGLVDVEGDQVCDATGTCGSPVSGDDFDEYEGPLKGYLDKYCYICGKSKPEKVLVAKVGGAQKIGCCNHCFENEVKQLAVREAGEKIVFLPGKGLESRKYEAR